MPIELPSCSGLWVTPMSRFLTASLPNGPRKVRLLRLTMLQLETSNTSSTVRTSTTMRMSASSLNQRAKSSIPDRPQDSMVEISQARSTFQSATFSLKMELSRVPMISRKSLLITKSILHSQLATLAVVESWQQSAELLLSRLAQLVSNPFTTAPGLSTARSPKSPNE